jgi:DNA topoisomerase-1
MRRRTRVEPVHPSSPRNFAGLRHVNDVTMAGHTPRRAAEAVRYVDPARRPVKDRVELHRIRALVIPPAWTDVWFVRIRAATFRRRAAAPDLQAVSLSREMAQRPRRGEVRADDCVCSGAPRIRQRTDADLKRSALPREKVLAAVVQLLEKTLIRVGNEEYAR